jgi:hypothetical protein
MSSEDESTPFQNFLGAIDTCSEVDVDISVCVPAIQKCLQNGEASDDDFPAVAFPIPMNPGFPQTEHVTREQYDQYRADRKERNNETRRLARDALQQAQAQAANELAHVVEPFGLCYTLRSLKQSGRLIDGMKLDLSGAANTVIQHVERIKQSIVDEVLKIIRAETGGAVPAPPATPATRSAPAAATHAPTSTPHPAPATDGIHRVAVTQPEVIDAKSSLPYKVPVHWRTNRRTSHFDIITYATQAQVTATPQPQPSKPPRQQRRKSTKSHHASNRKSPLSTPAHVAQAVAAALACLPSTSAASSSS